MSELSQASAVMIADLPFAQVALGAVLAAISAPCSSSSARTAAIASATRGAMQGLLAGHKAAGTAEPDVHSIEGLDMVLTVIKTAAKLLGTVDVPMAKRWLAGFGDRGRRAARALSRASEFRNGAAHPKIRQLCAEIQQLASLAKDGEKKSEKQASENNGLDVLRSLVGTWSSIRDEHIEVIDTRAGFLMTSNGGHSFTKLDETEGQIRLNKWSLMQVGEDGAHWKQVEADLVFIDGDIKPSEDLKELTWHRRSAHRNGEPCSVPHAAATVE